VARAKTGSGKTFAYLLPLLQKLFSDNGATKSGPSGFVLVPTRELCQQVIFTGQTSYSMDCNGMLHFVILEVNFGGTYMCL
jgi:superfamily II DNA/RNA helicase